MTFFLWGLVCVYLGTVWGQFTSRATLNGQIKRGWVIVDGELYKCEKRGG